MQHVAIPLGRPCNGHWQRNFGQRNGGKGMKTKKFRVPIPLPPFLCQFSFGVLSRHHLTSHDLTSPALSSLPNRTPADSRRPQISALSFPICGLPESAGHFFPLETAVEANHERHERHEKKGPNRGWAGPNYLSRPMTPSIFAGSSFVSFVSFVVPTAFSKFTHFAPGIFSGVPAPSTQPSASSRRPLRHSRLQCASASDLPLPSTGRGNEGEGWELANPRRFSPFPLCAIPISAVFCKTSQTPTKQPRATTATTFNSTTPL